MGKTAKPEDLLKNAKLKAARYCAYRERTQNEVREKLHGQGVLGQQAEAIIAELITEGFINEERFALAYASGKFRLKKWGKLKIKQGLQAHGLTPYCVDKGLAAIDEVDYQSTLQQLMKQKWASLNVADLFVKKHKTAQYLIGKGFEPEHIWELLKAPNWD